MNEGASSSVIRTSAKTVKKLHAQHSSSHANSEAEVGCAVCVCVSPCEHYSLCMFVRGMNGLEWGVEQQGSTQQGKGSLAAIQLV